MSKETTNDALFEQLVDECKVADKVSTIFGCLGLLSFIGGLVSAYHQAEGAAICSVIILALSILVYNAASYTKSSAVDDYIRNRVTVREAANGNQAEDT